ncbi:MAG: hypothetical protein MUO92_04750 [Dehalococcoidales bacterium]|nr:hypothetical protein [Dehalococcoidales bacterium]
MENATGILIFTVIVIGFIAVCALVCFVAYKPIKKIIGRYANEAGLMAAQPVDVQVFSSGEKAEKYIEEAQAQRLKMIEWVKQAEEMSRQKAQENGRKIMSDIKTKARREIGRELDDAVGQVRKEYTNITAPDTESVLNQPKNQ